MEGTNNFSKCDFCNGIGKVDYEKENSTVSKMLGRRRDKDSSMFKL